MSHDRKAARPLAGGWFAAFLVFAVGVFTGPQVLVAQVHAAQVQPAQDLAANVQPLKIVTKSGAQVPFSVEVATTDQEKQTGLMFRKELPDGKGMLFDFSPEQEVSMWMENTYIPLDMIFIRADGRILRIAENTKPMSKKIIPSMGLVKGVLEVPAGTAQKYGIHPGDHVAHPLFDGR